MSPYAMLKQPLHRRQRPFREGLFVVRKIAAHARSNEPDPVFQNGFVGGQFKRHVELTRGPPVTFRVLQIGGIFLDPHEVDFEWARVGRAKVRVDGDGCLPGVRIHRDWRRAADFPDVPERQHRLAGDGRQQAVACIANAPAANDKGRRQPA